MVLEVFFGIVNVAPPPPNGGVHSGLCGRIYYQKDASKSMQIVHQNNLSIELIVSPYIESTYSGVSVPLVLSHTACAMFRFALPLAL